eukprot:362239-Chlamydomonas_euryale.AAC.8
MKHCMAQQEAVRQDDPAWSLHRQGHHSGSSEEPFIQCIGNGPPSPRAGAWAVRMGVEELLLWSSTRLSSLARAFALFPKPYSALIRFGDTHTS